MEPLPICCCEFEEVQASKCGHTTYECIWSCTASTSSTGLPIWCRATMDQRLPPVSKISVTSRKRAQSYCEGCRAHARIPRGWHEERTIIPILPKSSTADASGSTFRQQSQAYPLDPERDFTPEEDATLLKLRADGRSWQYIADILPGRTWWNCRYRWSRFQPQEKRMTELPNLAPKE